MNARASRRPRNRRAPGPRTMRSVGPKPPTSGGGCVVLAVLALVGIAGLAAGVGLALAAVTA